MSDEAENVSVEPTIQPDTLETAPAAEEPTKIEFSDDQQKVFNDMAAKKAFETREARRESEDLRRQLEETKARIPQQVAPQVPDLPDPYDDNYEEQVRKRDDAIRASVNFEAQANARKQQAEQAQQAANHNAQVEHNKKVSSYADRAKTLGLTSEELTAAGSTVNNFGINPQVTSAIIEDDQGPLITKYLSENPMAIESLNTANPIMLGQVYNDIRTKASALGNKQRNAPNPVETLKGSGIPVKDDGPAGATYE